MRPLRRAQARIHAVGALLHRGAATPEHHLWAAVLVQAIHDHVVRGRRDATAWLWGGAGSMPVEDICEMCDLPVCKMRAAVRAITDQLAADKAEQARRERVALVAAAVAARRAG